jgi:uncharacterized protein YjbI with pentapeptide repeats
MSLAMAQQEEAGSAEDLTELERAKLEEEIRQLRIENDRSAGWMGVPILIAPALSAVVAVGGLAWAIWRQSKELAAARESAVEEAAQWRRELQVQQKEAADRNEHWEKEFERQQELDREETLRDRRDRFDARIADLMTKMGSEQVGVQLNAVSALGLFVRNDYPELHADLLATVLANLKLDPAPVVADLLRAHLARLLHLAAGREDVADLLAERLDLTRMNLYRFDGSDLRLPDTVTVDLYRSDLTKADFSGARMFRALGGDATLDGTRFSRAILREARFDGCTALSPVHFHGTVLHSATFKAASLRESEFLHAELQGAHFEDADLSRARFEGANLADARFRNATFDGRSKASIARGAYRWRDAHFDDSIRAELESLST